MAWRVDGVIRHLPLVSPAATSQTYYLGTTLTTQPGFTADYDDWIIGAPDSGTPD